MMVVEDESHLVAETILPTPIHSRKRKNTRAMHPRNKYAENPPDFSRLASQFPSFRAFVSYTPNGKARIDWTDFNATRELTRVLLKQDYGIEWWIPDGQLCPTVPNRANYIHWIGDLLASCPATWHKSDKEITLGLDIGTGANCIYPLLGAAIHGWHFVATDFTDTALTWARKNVKQNSHLADIAIRNVKFCKSQHDYKAMTSTRVVECNQVPVSTFSIEGSPSSHIILCTEAPEAKISQSREVCTPEYQVQSDMLLISPSNKETAYSEEPRMDQGSSDMAHGSQFENYPKGSSSAGPPVLVGVVNDMERFDFCMCNPPFFESIEEAGANPHTACGGTSEEMVCPGGEEGFIRRIIDDSTQLKEQIHWFTTLVGRKASLKVLIPKLRHERVSMLRTTEFVQGRTSRWGLAWSFSSVQSSSSSLCVMPDSSQMSFMLEGLPRHCRAYDILQSFLQHMRGLGAACKVDMEKFLLMGTFPDQLTEMSTPIGPLQKRQREACEQERRPFLPSGSDVQFSVSVFEQTPGTLLIKGKLLDKKNGLADLFSTMFSSAEQALKKNFCPKVQQRR